MKQRSRFLKIRCAKCKNEQVTTEKASSQVDCLVCGEVLARPQGGKAEIIGEVVEECN